MRVRAVDTEVNIGDNAGPANSRRCAAAMTGSDRRDAKAGLVGGALIAVVGIGLYWAMFYDMGYSSGRHERKANVEAEHYASDAATEIERKCPAKPAQAARECIARIVGSERESQREESDLAAQWKAADWVMWAGILAGVQVLATIIGLYFVKRTLDATLLAVEDTSAATEAMLKANKIAERTAQSSWAAYKDQVAAQRPVLILDIDDCLVRARPFESAFNRTGIGPVEALEMRFRFKNVGKQPCWIEAAWIGFYVGRFEQGRLTMPNQIEEQFRVMRAGFVQPGESVGSEGAHYRLPNDDLALLSAGGAGVVMYGVCQYRSLAKYVFGTRFAYQINVGENYLRWAGFPVDDWQH